MSRKALLRGILIAFGLYLVGALLARLIAARALYYPEMGSRRPPSGVQKIRDENDTEIALVYLPNPGARFTIWLPDAAA